MSFRNHNSFCVAPIVDSGVLEDSPTTSSPPFSNNVKTHVDFWAVGIDCCGADGQIAWRCSRGQSFLRTSPAALRWVETSARPYFRLAVEQATQVEEDNFVLEAISYAHFIVGKKTLLNEDGVGGLYWLVYGSYHGCGRRWCIFLKKKNRSGLPHTAHPLFQTWST